MLFPHSRKPHKNTSVLHVQTEQRKIRTGKNLHVVKDTTIARLMKT